MSTPGNAPPARRFEGFGQVFSGGEQPDEATVRIIEAEDSLRERQLVARLSSWRRDK